jgi:hypothetical protein
VDHFHQDVGVCSGQRVDEEVPRLCSQPLRVDVQCRDHIRKLEEDAFGGGHDVQDGTQQMAPTSADVGNRAEPAEAVGAEHRSDIGRRLGRHGLAEDRGFAGMTLQVGPQPLGRHLLQRRRASPDAMVELGEGGRKDGQAHHAGEGPHRHRVVAA